MTSMAATPRAAPVPGARVLVVEDDSTVADVVERYLRRDGHEVEVVGDGAIALARAEAEPPDLVILDLMLPGLDGLEVCRRLRASGTVPIIILSAAGEESDKLVGLELGADDYVAKPFSPRELAARVRTVLRRVQPAPHTRDDSPLHAGDIALDRRNRTVAVAGATVALTVREFDLLTYFMENPRCALSREMLLEQVWGYTFGDTSTVTVHVRRLREKIERDPATPAYVETVWGVGYRFAL